VGKWSASLKTGALFELILTQYDKQWKECIAVYVKSVEPFHLLTDMTAGLMTRQVSVGNFSTRRRQQETHAQPIPSHGTNQKGNRHGNRAAKGNGVRDTRHHQKDELQNTKGRIVTGPMILGLFSVIGHFIDRMGTRHTQESAHLIQGALNIHLSNIRETFQVLRRRRRRGRCTETVVRLQMRSVSRLGRIR
jgi:hypothetical protein